MNKKMMAVLLAVGLGAAACSNATQPTDPARDVDARSYYEDYQEGQEDGSPGAVNPQATMADGAVAPDRGNSGAVPPQPPPYEPGVLDDNVFVDSGDSTWIKTSADRESTFALDVDTGSFGIAEKLLAEGYLPEPASIRVEEWVNAFDYGDPAPEDGALGMTVEAAGTPRGEDGTALVRIGVSTQQLDAADRPTAHITFVIDTSGSMDIRERLGLVKASLALLVEHLRDDDTISIVTYGSEASPLLEPTPVAESDTILKAIDRLQPGGSTNMEAGLTLGYQQAEQALDPKGINVVVLASDGVANVGSTDPVVLTDQITQASKDGIHLVTVGYGMGNYNDVLMEQLADQGDGFYSYIDTFEEAERLFVEDLTPTLTVVAQDAKAQVVFEEDKVQQYRLVGYENRKLDDSDFTDDSVDAGELGAGHQVSALYEVQPAAGVKAGDVVGRASLRWATKDGGKAQQTDADITWPGTDPASDSLRLASVVADTAELFKGSEAARDRGLTLGGLRDEAKALSEAKVDGAQEIRTVIQEAVEAKAPRPDGDG